MSTLTAETILLPENCTHKLPTSCRLTATPTCCACQDKRQHTPSYQKYIDGVGFVSWGSRQDRYCWPCREFWNARVHISGMRQSDTAIPDRPDISEFLAAWYDWQRGYRVIKRGDGREVRQALVGELLSETGPGYLPRSTEELRNGLLPGEKEIVDRGGAVEQVPQAPVLEEDGDDSDSEYAQMFDSSDDERDPRSEPRAQAAAENGHLAELVGDQPAASQTLTEQETQSEQNSQPAQRNVQDMEDAASGQPLRIAREHYQRVASLRRELQRMRQVIERVMAGLQNSNINVPDSSQALEQINRLNGCLSRYREAPLEIPEIENPNYQSPISTMFERAWQRHNQLQSDRLHALALHNRSLAQDGSDDQNAARHTQITHPQIFYRNARQQEVSGSASRGGPVGTNAVDVGMAGDVVTQSRSGLMDLMSETGLSGVATIGLRQDGDGASNNISTSSDSSREGNHARFLGLDEPNRPPAIEDEEAFKVDNRCDVCLQQVANVATFPCGHMIMCSWCADEVVPRHRSARNIPRDSSAKCPQCRRKIKHVYTVRVRSIKEEATIRHQND